MPPIVTPAPRTGLNAIRIAEHAGVAVVTIRGALDAAATSALRDTLGWAVDHHDRVLVDWSMAGTVDRDGLGLVVAMQDRAHHRDVELRFTAPSPRLAAGLRALNADHLFITSATAGGGMSSVAVDQPGFALPRPARWRWPVACDR